jgi:hypothetical protein
MTLNPYADQGALTAYFTAQLAQDVLEDGFPEPGDQEWTNGVLKPYVVIDFGMPVATADGRSIAGEEKQPTVQRVVLSAVASSGKVARQIAGKIVESGTGFMASSNTGPLRLVGGGQFTQQVENRPSVYVSEVYFLYWGNMVDV